MGVKIGNNYLVHVAAPGQTPVFGLFAGQQDGDLGGSRQSIDASHKTSGGVALKIPGLLDIPLNLAFVAELPDADGYTIVETAFKAGTPVLVQVRKNGILGVDADKIFACSMYVMSLPVKFGLNGTVSGTVGFEPEAEPTMALTLS